MGNYGKSSFILLVSVVSLALYYSVIFAPPTCASNQEHLRHRTLYCIVVKITDGDTVHCETREKSKLKIRLYGIDAPEIPHGKIPGQPMGAESTAALRYKVFNKEVRIAVLDFDKHKRIVAMLWLGNRNINIEMVREGYAEAYREFLKNPYLSMFVEAERDAQTAKKGIWALAYYERPSAFKKRIRSR